MALVNLTTTISAGQALSAGVNCSSGSLLLVSLPANWSPANLTFQISTDGGNTYGDLFDSHAREITMTVAPGSAAFIDPGTGANKALAWIKFRSGSRDYPVPQAHDVSIGVSLDDGKGPP